MKIKKPLIIICLLVLIIPAAGQSGGNYTITQSVIAGGGGQNSTGGAYSLDGTIGQAVTGGSQSYPYILKSGFWTPSMLLPTAASVSVSGRVLTANGRGIRNVMIIMTDSSGAIRTATTTSFGYYTFAEVPAGETYILTARAKRFNFTQPTQVVGVTEETTEINFIAADAPREL